MKILKYANIYQLLWTEPYSVRVNILIYDPEEDEQVFVYLFNSSRPVGKWGMLLCNG